MGHLYRQLNFASLLSEKGEQCVFFVNDDADALKKLSGGKFQYETVSLCDYESGWENRLIEKYGITTWVDDRLDTDLRHARNVKKSPVSLVVFDDLGAGAELADFNFSALYFDDPHRLKGKRVYTGTDYLILNREIDSYKRLRSGASRILVTMGGSDSYGVTVPVVKILKAAGLKATVIAGPSFRHWKELEAEACDQLEIKKSVSSLIAEFSNYDRAITGGGVTAFEANASGLPCAIVANEIFEIPNAKYLESIGSSVFAGYREEIDAAKISGTSDVGAMSRAGLAALNTGAAEKICSLIANV
jgi:spore coat polysaccharide biosynthesis predicted glycosyltransferase SpsG